jgi:hypothetical protein
MLPLKHREEKQSEKQRPEKKQHGIVFINLDSGAEK